MDSPGESDHKDDGRQCERGGSTISPASPPSLPNPSQNNDLAFPMRLHEMIQWVESNYPLSSRPMNWLSSGRAFMIRDHDELTTTILPRFFNQSKIESFARKLNRWGFSIIRSGPEKGAYMHKDFVRWEEPFSITSMSKDRRRKRKSTSSKASSSAEKDSPTPNKSASPIVGDEDDRKMPAQNEVDAKNDPFRRKRTLEAIDSPGQHKQRTSHDSRARQNQAFEHDNKIPPHSCGNTNPNYAATSGAGIQSSTTEHTAWKQALSLWNQSESLLNTDNLGIRGGEQSIQLNDSIGVKRLSKFPQNIEYQDNSSNHAQNDNRNYQTLMAPQPMNFSPSQTGQFNITFPDNTNMATGNTGTNTTLTSFNDVIIPTINSISMPNALLTNNSTMHGIEARNVSDFANNHLNSSKTAFNNNYQAFEIHLPMNFPSAQPGQINSMISGNTNINTESYSNNMMPRSHDGMMTINNDIMISYNTQRNAAMHRFGTADARNIIYPTSNNNLNVAGESDVYKEDILSPLAIFSPNFDRDVAEGRITFTTAAAAAAARNEDYKEETKGTSTTPTTGDLNDNQIDLDLSDYFQQLEKSIWSEEKKQRRA